MRRRKGGRNQGEMGCERRDEKGGLGERVGEGEKNAKGARGLGGEGVRVEKKRKKVGDGAWSKFWG